MYLLAGTAVLAPVLLHLLLRNRPQRKILPTMRFLPGTSQQSVAMHRLKNILLLILRAAAVLLIALAFSRPYFERRQIVPAQDEAGEAVVFAIDASMSMRANDRWRVAVDRAMTLNRALAADSRRGVVVFDRAPQVACGDTDDALAVETALKQAAPGYGSTDLAAGVRAAADLAATMNAKTRNVYVISDFQRAGFKQITGSIDIPEGISLTPMPIAEEEHSANVAIAACAEKPESLPGHRLVRVQVAAFNTDKADGTVTLESGNKSLESRAIHVGAGDRVVEDFDLPLSLDAQCVVTARVDIKDALPDDNALTVVLPARVTLPLLVCTPTDVVAMGGPEASRTALPGANPYLKAVVAAFGATVRPTWLAPAQVGTLPAREYRAAIANAPESFPAKAIESLKAFVRDGGVLVVFPGDGDPSVLQDLAGVRTDGWESSIDRDQFQLVTYVASDSALTSLDESGATVLGFPKAFRYLKVVEQTPDPAGSGAMHAIARLDNSLPFVVERKMGQGTVYLFTAPLAPKDSDLVLRAGFTPFLYHLLDRGVDLIRPKTSYIVGDTLVDATDGAVLAGPDGREFDAELLRRPLASPGAYTLRQAANERVFAVRTDPEESDLTPLDSQRIAAMGRTASIDAQTLVASAADVARNDSDPDANQQVWWYLMAAALACLGAETMVASRTSR